MTTKNVLTGFVAALALGGVVLTTTSPAEARGGPRAADFSFSEVDADGNGELTEAEITAHLKARFEARDTDGDGALSKEEMLAAARMAVEERGARRADRMIERRDANGDGLLQFEEIGPESGQPRRLMRLDRDDSGTISQEEFDTAMNRLMDRRDGRGRGDGHRGGKHRN